MFAYIMRPTRSSTWTGSNYVGSRTTLYHSPIFGQRISSTARSNIAAKKPPKDGLSSPLPAPSLSTPKYLIDPVKAKQRYLESKQRTEEFLKDPQKKMNQLQGEINQVKERLDKEVYNKSVWQRLTDPLKRKQHSLINMIAGTFAYILAFQLHLKRLANQQLTEEVHTQEEMVKDLKVMLRSLLEDDYIQDIATTVASEKIGTMSGSTKKDRPWLWMSAGMFSTAATERDGLSPDQIETIAQILRRKLEERIGDEGLDEHATKERDMERVWMENQRKMESKEEDHVTGLLALAEEDGNQQQGDSGTMKQRIFDM